MFALFTGMSGVLLSDLRRFVVEFIRREVKAYANARKRAHYGFTIAIFFVEVAAIFSVHEPLVHLFLSGGVTSWEALIIRIGEESL